MELQVGVNQYGSSGVVEGAGRWEMLGSIYNKNARNNHSLRDVREGGWRDQGECGWQNIVIEHRMMFDITKQPPMIRKAANAVGEEKT